MYRTQLYQKEYWSWSLSLTSVSLSAYYYVTHFSWTVSRIGRTSRSRSVCTRVHDFRQKDNSSPVEDRQLQRRGCHSLFFIIFLLIVRFLISSENLTITAFCYHTCVLREEEYVCTPVFLSVDRHHLNKYSLVCLSGHHNIHTMERLDNMTFESNDILPA